MTPSTPAKSWSELFDEMYVYVTNPKNWINGKPVWDNYQYVTVHAAIKSFISTTIAQAKAEERREMVEKLKIIKFNDDEIFKHDGKYVDTNYTKLGFNEGIDAAITTLKTTIERKGEE